MQQLLTQLLNLEGIAVEDYRDLGEQLVLKVEVILDWANYPRCGQTSHNVHQNHFHLVRDLFRGSRYDEEDHPKIESW